MWLFLQESDTEEKSDADSRESDQIKTLSESLFTLTQEKSKLEGVYLADKKRLLVSFFHLKFYIMEAWWSIFGVSKYFQTIWICLIIIIDICMDTPGSMVKHWFNHTSSILFRWNRMYYWGLSPSVTFLLTLGHPPSERVDSNLELCVIKDHVVWFCFNIDWIRLYIQLYGNARAIDI